MKIKEFSEKNSLVLFYTSVIFIIISIVLGFYLYGSNTKSKNFPTRAGDRGLMQGSRDDSSQIKRLNRNQTGEISPTGGQPNQTEVTPPTETPTPIINQ